MLANWGDDVARDIYSALESLVCLTAHVLRVFVPPAREQARVGRASVECP